MQSQDMIFVPAGSGERLKILGSIHTNKATPAETGGAFSAIEITVPPRCGPPMHAHDLDCELFYMLEGEITFSHASGSVVAKPGDLCFLPSGRAHAFRNEGTTDAKALVVISPGMKAHQFFHEIHERLDGAVDVPVVEDLARRNGIFLDPPQVA